MAVEVPQNWEMEVGARPVGLMESVVPVYARSDLRWDNRQSIVPSRWRTQNVVRGDFEEMSRERGVVEVIRW